MLSEENKQYIYIVIVLVNVIRRKMIIYSYIIMLLLGGAFLSWPYSYYQILRICTTIFFAMYSYDYYKKQNNLDVYSKCSIAIAILYNPIIKIHFIKEIWTVVNIITLVFIIYGITTKRIKGMKNDYK